MPAFHLDDFISHRQVFPVVLIPNLPGILWIGFFMEEISIIGKGKVCAQGTTEALLAQSGRNNLEDAFVALAGIDDESLTTTSSTAEKAA